MARTPTKEPKPRDLKGALQSALTLFQKYRVIQCCLTTTGTTDMCRCFTSGRIVERNKDLHGGHYILSSKLSTAFEPMNIHAQTRGQNIALHGNRDIYRQKLVDKYGEPAVVKLEIQSKQPKHLYDFTFEWIDEHRAFWNKEIKRMLKEKKL
jgi:hypothetical protein